jgi:hypothetical protein
VCVCVCLRGVAQSLNVCVCVCVGVCRQKKIQLRSRNSYVLVTCVQCERGPHEDISGNKCPLLIYYYYCVDLVRITTLGTVKDPLLLQVFLLIALKRRLFPKSATISQIGEFPEIDLGHV